MNIEEITKDFLDNNSLEDKFNETENIKEIQSLLLSIVNKSIFIPIEKKDSLFKTKAVCPSCKAKIISNKKEFKNIIYCPYCGQRVKERTYITIDDTLVFGNENEDISEDDS